MTEPNLDIAGRPFSGYTDEDWAYLRATIEERHAAAALEPAEQRPPLTPVEINRFAQYLYEAINASGDEITLNMSMTSKPTLVDAITKALGRLR